MASAKRYDSLEDRTTKSVKDLYTQAMSQYDLLELFRDNIIPEVEQPQEV